ncbi:flagellar assembly protein FliH [Mangrovimicrobium sediminis]|uniref:Flagellar assembly protein FliH n=1 Tax=Mangrovimicrobium sediminis TaxID=2562682 RepID=A0A4Z0M0U3_9GAMM|nr:FliH/SctL family protein [Haliea sp. SAOS-164]TGD73151.1 flagellar assembly protein FliH [Haliea sp. SAOS-164]
MSSTRRDLELIGGASPWRHWEMDSLDKPRQPRSAAVQPEQPAAAEASAQRAALAQDKAFKKARADGLREGREEGRKAGYEAGLAEGRAAAQAELEQRSKELLQPIGELAEEFSHALGHMSEEVTGQLVELALAIGQSMALECIEEHPEIATIAVRSILESEVAPGSHPQLLLNPVDIDAVRSALGDELAVLGWQIKPDERVSRGGCLVKSELSQIDATWESRWRTLTAKVRRRQPGAGQDTADKDTSGKDDAGESEA